VWIKESIELQNELVAQVSAGRGITPLAFTPVLDYGEDVKTRVEAIAGEGTEERSGRLVIPPSGVAISDDDVRALRDADQR